MARFHGNVGYAPPGEFVDGVWSGDPVERPYYGDVLSESVSMVPTDQVNDDIRLQNRISIVADAFAFEHFQWIKYVEWVGSLWAVTNVVVERPRLILSLGGVWNGEVAPELPESP